ncbi:hypothetical protein VHUM_00854 [Vanrija humicola]|uniref:Uncharacterized protein n=1 Tax=Vanrija humicola TaxID=5417 RepID=A0A7D8V3J0_VANHU|nr:hypothetical protein VHUM_00854 [Vanrija humicola]
MACPCGAFPAAWPLLTPSQASAALKPESQKTYLEQAGDALKSAADSVASAVQPQQEKSTTQKVGDASELSFGHDAAPR